MPEEFTAVTRTFAHNPVRGRFEFASEDADFLNRVELVMETPVLAQMINMGAKVSVTLFPMGNVGLEVRVSEELDYVTIFDLGGACTALLTSKTAANSLHPRLAPDLERFVDYTTHEVVWRMLYVSTRAVRELAERMAS